MVHAKHIYTVLIALAVTPALATSLGISPPLTQYDYQPGFNETLTITMSRFNPSANNVTLNVSGALSDHVTLSRRTVDPKGGPQTVQATIDPPQDAGVGEETIKIKASENFQSSDQFGSRVAVTAKILIDFPYPGRHVRIESLNAPNVNQGEPTAVSYQVKSLGTESYRFTHDITVKDASNTVVKTADLGTSDVTTQETVSGAVSLDTSSLQPGVYTVTYDADWETGNTSETTTLRVGEKTVSITNVSAPQLQPNSTEEITVGLQNNWNGEISDVYAELRLADQTVTTPTTSLEAFQAKELNQFITTNGVEPGNHTLSVTVHYDTNTTTTTTPVTIAKPERQTPPYTLVAIITACIILGVWLWRRNKS